MSNQAFIEIKLVRRPDDSYFYQTMKDWERERVYNAVSAATTTASIIFAAGGHTYEYLLDEWSVYMNPIC